MSLRDRQKALARAEILRATAELVADRAHLDFSIAEVAEAAGVSLRTVYNHFADREALLDALTERWTAELRAHGGPLVSDITDLDDLIDAAQVMFGVSAELGGLSDAYARLDISRAQALDHGRDDRTAAFADLAEQHLPHLDPAVARAIGLLLRHVASQRSWWSLTRDYGMSQEDATRYTAWLMRTIIDAARQGVEPPPPPTRRFPRGAP